MKDGRSIGWFLALFGFVPFAVGTLIELLPLQSDFLFYKAISAKMLPAYGAVILSFLGGIRWGIAVADNPASPVSRTLAWSVVPSLWGWAAVFWAAPINYLMLAVGFAAMGMWDRKLIEKPHIPRWFVELRKVLSVLVTVAMLTCAFAAVWPLIMIGLSQQ